MRAPPRRSRGGGGRHPGDLRARATPPHKAPDANEALTWVYRIATSYCLNEIRDRKLRPRSEAELPESGGASLEATLADRDLCALIIRRCPEKLRAVAWLHHVDGLDHAPLFEDNPRRFAIDLGGSPSIYVIAD